MLGDVIVGLFALRCVQSTYEEQLFSFGSRSEFALERSRIVRIGSNGRVEGPSNASVKQFEANPPLCKVRICLSVTVKVCEVVERRVLKIKTNTARGGNEPPVHSRSLLVRENRRVCGFTLNIHDDVRRGSRLCPSKCLRLQIERAEHLRTRDAQLSNDGVGHIGEIPIQHCEGTRVILDRVKRFEIGVTFRARHLHLGIVNGVPRKDRHWAIRIPIADYTRVRSGREKDEILPSNL